MLKNKKSVIIISLIIVIVLCISIIFINKSKSPTLEQIQSDFISEKFDSEDFEITDFIIESENYPNDNEYEAIIVATYDDDEIEYVEKYTVKYYKNEKWVFEDIDNYDKDTWSKRPLNAPNIDEFKQQCLAELKNRNDFYEYEEFTANNDKTVVNLDEGKTTFAFSAKNNTPIQTASGEIIFTIMFDYEYGKWYVDDYTYSDSFDIKYDLIHTWTGSAAHNGYHDSSEPYKESFTFEINNFDEESATGIVAYKGSTYTVSGKIAYETEVGKKIEFDLSNADKQMRIDGYITIDGKINASVDTAYKPNASFYYPKNRYNVNMIMK